VDVYSSRELAEKDISMGKVNKFKSYYISEQGVKDVPCSDCKESCLNCMH
jgi:hypothetical protein